MIGIVIVTHGQLGQEFINTLEHIMGPQEFLSAVSVDADADARMENCREHILDEVKKNNTGHGVVLLTDMFGGTPSNLALSLIDQAKIEIIAGVNLPLLIKLVSVRKTMTLHDAVKAAQEAGQKYIHVASNILDTEPERYAQS